MFDNDQQLSGNAGDVAVVGMAIRAPGARSVEEYWRNVAAGTECISFFEREELRARGVSPEALANPDFVPAGGVLEDADRFAASFFGYVAREAETIDPQHRVFLECAWEALEDAGCDSKRHDGLIGLYAGSTMNTYMLVNLMSNRDVLDLVGDLQTMIGNDKEYLATRASYKLDLRGPAYSVQTACSTSLVAIHVACQALLSGECDVALAGGSSVRVPQGMGYLYQPGSTSSPDGHCRAFDAEAAGSVVGSGAGVVVLKLLADAIADGDTVRAVIKGSAINNDGAAKASFTAPSVDGQAAAIAGAIEISGVGADSIGYVEAHGTGTLLGDPIEVAALSKGFGRTTSRRGFCALGSVKPNIGHLDAAAGVLSFVKAVLSVERGTIPPSINFERPNPKIDFAASPFYVNTEARPWTGEEPRRASVNSVGIGGTNAHVVIEQPPAPAAGGPSRPWQLLPLSARSAEELVAAGERLAERLEQPNPPALADVSHTLRAGRRDFPHRRALAVGDREAAIVELRRAASRAVTMTGRPVAFMFSGQGSQHPGMLRDLHEREAVFREHLDAAAEQLAPQLGLDLREAIYAEGAEIVDTALAQPALFAVEHALARLLIEWGLEPESMIGHSIGEYVAACIAGVFSPEDALRVVAARGRLVGELEPGAMLSVQLTEEELLPRLNGDLALAAVNAPSLCVAAGPTAQVEELAQALGADGIDHRRLVVSHAFHSPMMEPALLPLEELLGPVELRAPSIPFISNVSGTWISDEEACDPGYWARHLRQPVRFGPGVGELLAEPARLLLEVGPGTALTTFASQLEGAEERAFAAARHPRSGSDDQAGLLIALGRLWTQGADLDLAGLGAAERRFKVPLPTYPFSRERFWIEPRAAKAGTIAAGEDWPEDAGAESGLFAPGWRRTAPLPVANGASAGTKSLVFAGASPLSRGVVAALAGLGADVTIVRPGEAFERLGERTFAIDPGAGGDYERLVTELDGREPELIVHTWAIDAAERNLPTKLRLGAGSMMHLARCLGENSAPLQAIAAGVHEVTGGEPLCAETATVAGVCSALADERCGAGARLLDVELPGPEPEAAAALARRLVAELIAGSEPVVALRGAHRWTRTWEPLAGGSEPRLRAGGSYLVGGDVAGVGASAAGFLAETLAPRLALVDAPEEASAALAGLGAEVLELSTEDGGSHGAAVAEARRSLGDLHGFLYTHEVGDAAVNGIDESLRELRREIEAVTALGEALGEAEPEFCLLATSLSTDEGGVVASALSSFMDAFAHRSGRGGATRWISASGSEWGSDALTLLLSAAPATQIRVADRPPRERTGRPERGAPAEEAAPLATSPLAASSSHQRPDLQSSYSAPRNEVERELVAIWEELLGIEGVGVDDNFFELGGHSLLATQLITRLRRCFGGDLTLASLFEGPTVASMAAVVAGLDRPEAERPSGAESLASPTITGDAGFAEQLEEGIVEEVLAEIEALPEDEVRAQLDERLRQEENLDG